MKRRIIHIDMDCFYAAVEMRERPELAKLPLAVGGRSRRGVLTTCNYVARQFGIRSAMPTWQALDRCPDLVVVPVRFDLYREDSRKIRQILHRYTPLVEPLSLDEAYLDVSDRFRPAMEIAREIRLRVLQETGLSASAGVAPNKMLAKIASDWEKPDGLTVIEEAQVQEFLDNLPVRKLWGIGPRAAERLQTLGIETCGKLRAVDPREAVELFGRQAVELLAMARGEDNRPVKPHRARKSLSSEETFSENLDNLQACRDAALELLAGVELEIKQKKLESRVSKCFVKLKFDDFSRTSVETPMGEGGRKPIVEKLLAEGWARRQGRSVRLIGVGVRFTQENNQQPEFTFEAV